MKTMPKIDEPIPFDKPIELKNSLLEIQKYHRRILRYSRNFDAKIQSQRRLVAANLPGILRERAARARIRQFHERQAAERQERREAKRRRDEREAEHEAQRRKPLHAKRRSIAPKRINIKSFSGQSYQ